MLANRMQCVTWIFRRHVRLLRRVVIPVFLVVLILLLAIVHFHRLNLEGHHVRNVREYANELNYVLNHAEICGKDKGSSLPLLMVVYSDPSHFSERFSLRMTWASYALEKGAKLIFLLGRTNNEFHQREVEAEDLGYQDIVQAGFLDSYRNLTLKTHTMLKWVVNHCSRVPFVLKIDDDVFLNVDAMLRFLGRARRMKKAIFGEMHEGATPFRIFTKWRVSYTEYPDSAYPRYIKGPSYLLTGGAVLPLYKAGLDVRFLFLEDVFTTGLVAEKASVQRIHHPDMHFHAQRVDFCTYRRIVTSHGHGPEEIREIWRDIRLGHCGWTLKYFLWFLIAKAFLVIAVLAYRYAPRFLTSSRLPPSADSKP